MTTFAEKLKHTAEESVLRETTKREEEKKRVLKKVMDAVRSASQHAAKTGHLECEIHCDECLELNDTHRHRVIPAVHRELAAMGFNKRTVSWQFSDKGTEDSRHLVLTLGWDEPLDQGQVNDALNPPEVAKEPTT